MFVCLFFKQKTAYERRMSDWSSDLFSSDLPGIFLGDGVAPFEAVLVRALGAAARFVPLAHRLPSAASLGALAQMAFDRGETADPAELAPLYIRRSEAELTRERRRHVGSPH